MSDPTVRGSVHLIEETKTYGQKGFRKRLVVLEQPGDRFTNYVPVEFTQDRCDSVDGLSVGDEIEVTYKLNGRRWQKDSSSEVKFFVNVEAQRFQKVGGGAPAGDAAASDTNIKDANAALAEASFDDDEVPF